MHPRRLARQTLAPFALLLLCIVAQPSAHAQQSDPAAAFAEQEVMIPMRDGVKLHTVILIPKGARHAGILFTRTPYDANALTRLSMSGHLGPTLQGYDNVADIIVEDGYIRVVQDVRG